MKIFNFIIKNSKSTKESGKFSDFFRTTSEKKQFQVLRKAARRANEDQKKLYEESAV